MKAILIVVAVLLAVTHLGDTQGDHTIPHSPFREPLVVVCVSVSSLFIFTFLLYATMMFVFAFLYILE